MIYLDHWYIIIQQNIKNTKCTSHLKFKTE